MTQSVKIIIFFLFIATITMGTQCDRYENITTQGFAEKTALYPAKKVYNINDTIFLRYTKSSKILFDEISKRSFPSGSVKFSFGATLIPMHETPFNPAGGFCSFVLPGNATATYTTTQNGTGAYVEVPCDNATGYDIEIGIVPKYKGIYVLRLPETLALKACSNQVNPYRSSWLRFTYNVADCNKDIYLSVPDSLRLNNPAGVTEGQIDFKLVYALRVQ